MTSGQQLRGAFTTTVAGEVSKRGGGGTGALCTGYTLIIIIIKSIENPGRQIFTPLSDYVPSDCCYLPLGNIRVVENFVKLFTRI
jgi:hypothetical protein